MLSLAQAALTLCFFVWLVGRLLPRADRVLAMLESTRNKPVATAAREPMPLDLVARAKAWADPWAQEAAMRTIEEAYTRTGSWDGARTAVDALQPPSELVDS